MCLDSSGSMTGGREMWSKAVMLNLLHTAREQRRQMHVIHFGSPSRVKIDSFVEPQDFTPDRIIEAAGTFWGGGTDFHTPMQRALQILVEEHERTGVTRADVVFATDDECQVAPEFMETYLAEMRRIGARTFGLNMSDVRTAPDGALAVMSEGRVASLQDLRSGRDVQAMLRTPAMRR
jgi:uncharacterized protein with von Willebrand factor type A (vWA) domain